MTTLLADPYYSRAHEVFRSATNQTALMVEHMVDRLQNRSRLSICSVGSGAGLFEIPMLARLHDEGIAAERFVGVDASEHACAVLESKLAASAHPGLDYELVATPFETFETGERFDIVLFNHVVEYLAGDALPWLEKSMGLVMSGGSLLVFSPTRGGINVPYEEGFVELTGAPPIFADDIERMLDDAGIAYVEETIIASCDVSLLDRFGSDAEKVMLLSFLAQRDCRDLSDDDCERYVEYYRSLRPPGERGVAHPTTLFVI